MQNGRPNNETVADIKERAKDKASSVTKAKGISATSLMRVAQDLAFEAQKAEDSGDLKKSLGLWVQASGLLSALYDTADFKAESKPGKKGAIYKEVTEWMQVSFLAEFYSRRSKDHDSCSTRAEARRRYHNENKICRIQTQGTRKLWSHLVLGVSIR